MMFLDELYQKSIADSDNNLKFWENYLSGLKSLNFNVFAEKLKVPTLVPIGSRIFFRGELKHTNEVMVSLGADYFVKCTVNQAEILRQHRIKDAQSKVDLYKKEKEYLENRISFTKQNVHEKNGQEILETYSEEEDKAWREKHKENVKKYKQKKAKDTQPKDNITDEELWERLEELELQEELENDLMDNYHEIVDKRKQNTFLVNEETLLLNSLKEESLKNSQDINQQKNTQENMKVKLISKDGDFTTTDKDADESSKHDLLQKVLDKQHELENKLHELKNKEREQSKTEQDLISRLDEMEELDELEDEMERLDDILKTESIETGEDFIESEKDGYKAHSTKLKKIISFAEDNDGETLEINFTHSNTEPNKKPFIPKTGVLKPSDLYEAHSHLFDSKTTSILKKSKYEPKSVNEFEQTAEETINQNIKTETDEPEEITVGRTIVIKDVTEKKEGVNQHKIEGGARPTSLFKKKRMQQNQF